ncbi:hypothetical protein CsatB_029550 [Cannabis sativa]|uniref:RING-type E3 ubiquitin transferase n=1 Tax=Cannabis sativa TaxID=3483 RepID=A0A7J6ETN0_CANSA|nr:hypothetical protein F8388_018969 [Cannabis sativa]KAF4389923.1 hypothetical protein G4B88_003406 [Cannabis sativa]
MTNPSLCLSKREIDALIFLCLLLPAALPYAGAQPPSNNENDPYAYNRFSPSMAIIIVVLIAALFFMGFFSIYIRHCSDAQAAADSAAAGAGAGRSRRAARGIDAAVLETFPTLEYSAVKGLKIGKGALECAVCLCEFEDDETLRLIPKCDHVFHPECIDAWLESHTTCPVCRANLVPGPDESLHRPEFPTQAADIEAQNDAAAVEPAAEERTHEEQLPSSVSATEPYVLDMNKTLNRNRTRGSRSSRISRFFPRSHSTGHSLIQPGENTERFTLRLPAEVRKEIIHRQLERATSLLVLPRENSSRRGYRGGGEGSSRGGRFGKRVDRLTKSDRWNFSRSFFNRMSSMKSPKVAANDGEGTSSERIIGPDVPRSNSVRPPV